MTTGLIPVLATPFHPSGELDLESLQRLVDFQVSSGVDGVAVFGFASEGFALTAAERAQILASSRAAGLPVVAGRRRDRRARGGRADPRCAATHGASRRDGSPALHGQAQPGTARRLLRRGRRATAGCRSWSRTPPARPASTCRCR